MPVYDAAIRPIIADTLARGLVAGRPSGASINRAIMQAAIGSGVAPADTTDNGIQLKDLILPVVAGAIASISPKAAHAVQIGSGLLGLQAQLRGQKRQQAMEQQVMESAARANQELRARTEAVIADPNMDRQKKIAALVALGHKPEDAIRLTDPFISMAPSEAAQQFQQLPTGFSWKQGAPQYSTSLQKIETDKGQQPKEPKVKEVVETPGFGLVGIMDTGEVRQLKLGDKRLDKLQKEETSKRGQERDRTVEELDRAYRSLMTEAKSLDAAAQKSFETTGHVPQPLNDRRQEVKQMLDELSRQLFEATAGKLKKQQPQPTPAAQPTQQQQQQTQKDPRQEYLEFFGVKPGATPGLGLKLR
jgi:hypothetical protein